MPDPSSPNRMLQVSPRFLVTDIHRAAAYYRDVLGFTIDRMWGDPPGFCIPHRDGMQFMLGPPVAPDQVRALGADGESWDAYVHVSDADALYAEFVARGADIVHPPVDRTYYRCREFAVRDPDSHIIAFAHNLVTRPDDPGDPDCPA